MGSWEIDGGGRTKFEAVLLLSWWLPSLRCFGGGEKKHKTLTSNEARRTSGKVVKMDGIYLYRDGSFSLYGEVMV